MAGTASSHACSAPLLPPISSDPVRASPTPDGSHAAPATPAPRAPPRSPRPTSAVRSSRRTALAPAVVAPAPTWVRCGRGGRTRTTRSSRGGRRAGRSTACSAPRTPPGPRTTSSACSLTQDRFLHDTPIQAAAAAMASTIECA
uniref:Uncharacterized protein n=1 Tax=Triticum urartu TaxID=4572 RepID=A0A8R7U6R3_TRIUA